MPGWTCKSISNVAIGVMQMAGRQRLLKLGVFGASLIPLAVLAWQTVTDNLGANPIKEITEQTGLWTLRFVLITLAVTPVRRLTGWHKVIQLRRMLGLFAFFYGTLHFMTYIWLDQFFMVDEIIADVVARPFITVGFASFVLLIPLAITSTTTMIKRLGGKWWQRLHRTVYVIGLGGVLHYLWLVKADVRSPLTYGGLLALLLGYRVWAAYRRRPTPEPMPRRQAAMNK
jgi:methionine sulfoxide reductase heme-binding subunit